MDGNGTGDIWGTTVRNKKIVFFLVEVASSNLNFHGGFFRKYGHLGLKKNLNAPRPSEHPPVRGKKCQNV